MRVTTCEEEKNADDEEEEEEEEEDEDDDDDDGDDVEIGNGALMETSNNKRAFAYCRNRSGLLFLRETVSNFALFFSPFSNCCCLFCNLLQLRGPHIIFNVILTLKVYLCI